MVDERDRAILDELKRDGRASVRTLAKRLGMRPSTVHQHMKRLKEDGVIRKYTIAVDHAQLGEELVVFMLVSGPSSKYLDRRLLGNHYVHEVFGVTGEYDVMLKLRFPGIQEFNEFVIDFRDTYSDAVTKTVTMIGTIDLKEGG